MNGMSPFNYRKLTPEQERRGEKVASNIGMVCGILCLVAAVAIAAIKVWGMTH